jgi:hypothetical protein
MNGRRSLKRYVNDREKIRRRILSAGVSRRDV